MGGGDNDVDASRVVETVADSIWRVDCGDGSGAIFDGVR